MKRVVTVAIPTLNGAETLDAVLSAVGSQQVDADVELLLVDSGSTDGSLRTASKHGATIHSIPSSQYSHGGTRNLIMRLARGEHVAFLTQDAIPAHDTWLAALLEGFEAAPNVAAVFGPHLPRPGASHMIRRELAQHFAIWGDEGIDVQRLDRSPRGMAQYRADPGRLTFLSDVNCCLARSAWEKVPFREVPYAEDQLLGRQLIEAGYAKVFHPRAQVLHSHDYRPITFVRRYFDEYRGLREVLGYREPRGLVQTLRSVRAQAAADRRWLVENGAQGLALRRAHAVSIRHYGLRQAGAILGSRADRLPARLRGLLSLEGRATFAEHPVTISATEVSHFSRRPVATAEDWDWDFVRRSFPRRPISLAPSTGRPTGRLTIAWVVPPWGIGSGGHMTIFRLVRELERLGHQCAIYLFDPFRLEHRPAHELRAEIWAHFMPINAPVFVGLDDFDSADVVLATNWWTAYAVRDLPRCLEKAYLVQDYEPAFHATSAQSLWAEETYRMGLRCLAFTPWLVDILKERFDADASWFEFGTDTKTYRFFAYEDRLPEVVAVYARRETERRAVELAFAGLATLLERRPSVHVVLFGSAGPARLPFHCDDLGIVPPRELADLYRQASVGVSLSLTNLSLVSLEMMASGLPLVELDSPNVRSVLGESGELGLLAEPTPDAIAMMIERALDDRLGMADQARRARAYVEARPWRVAAAGLEALLRSFVASPRASGATQAALEPATEEVIGGASGTRRSTAGRPLDRAGEVRLPDH